MVGELTRRDESPQRTVHSIDTTPDARDATWNIVIANTWYRHAEREPTMTATTFTAVQTVAVAAAVLVAAVAAFQFALAMGAPLGEAVFGGRAPTSGGALTVPFRALAVVQTILLLLLGWVLLARSGVVAIPLLGTGAVLWATWGIVLFLALNTLANFSAPHPVERWVMGSITLTLTGLGLFIALRAPDIA